MGFRELIGAMGMVAALTPHTLAPTQRRRRQSDYDHFNQKEWKKRKKRMKAQRAARKITRQHTK